MRHNIKHLVNSFCLQQSKQELLYELLFWLWSKDEIADS